MNEIKCPHCSTVFTINETEYNQLLDQIRNHEFEKEIQARVDLELKNQKTEFDSQLRLKESEFKNKLDNELSVKDNEISKLTLLIDKNESDFENKMSETLLEQQLTFEKQLNKLESEIQELNNQKTEFDSQLRLKESDFKNKLDNELSVKDNEISKFYDAKYPGEYGPVSIKDAEEIMKEYDSSEVGFFKPKDLKYVWNHQKMISKLIKNHKK